jgi:hypothetical protein
MAESREWTVTGTNLEDGVAQAIEAALGLPDDDLRTEEEATAAPEVSLR